MKNYNPAVTLVVGLLCFAAGGAHSNGPKPAVDIDDDLAAQIPKDIWLNQTYGINFPPTARNTCHDEEFTLDGAVDGDVIALGVPVNAWVDGVTYNAYVKTKNTVAIRTCCHATALTPFCPDPPYAAFTVSVLKHYKKGDDIPGTTIKPKDVAFQGYSLKP